MPVDAQGAWTPPAPATSPDAGAAAYYYTQPPPDPGRITVGDGFRFGIGLWLASVLIGAVLAIPTALFVVSVGASMAAAGGR